MTDAGRRLLRDVEQLRLVPYDDRTGRPVTEWCKGATIGYGHLITRNAWDRFHDGITAARAEDLFARDLHPYECTVTDLLRVEVAPYQFDALVILAYNIGLHGFKISSVLQLINDPGARTAYPSLEAAWAAWHKQRNPATGKLEYNQGLVNRRAAEWALYSTGEYRRW